MAVPNEGVSMKIGSQEHRDAFCAHFRQTHIDYDPKTLPWPELDTVALRRLQSVPFWEEVFYTERRAGAIVAAFTATVGDPVLKAALALQGEEETRHAALIRVMIDKYGLDALERPMENLDSDIETRFKDFGFGECLDSFLGFGLFKIAWQAEFLPREILQIFATLMYEETRHIVFFINWMAYTEARQGWLARTVSPLTSLRYYLRALKRMAGLAPRQAVERRQELRRHPDQHVPRRFQFPALPRRLLCREQPPHERLRAGVAASELPASVDRRRPQGAAPVECARGGRPQHGLVAPLGRRPPPSAEGPSGARGSIAQRQRSRPPQTKVEWRCWIP